MPYPEYFFHPYPSVTIQINCVIQPAPRNIIHDSSVIEINCTFPLSYIIIIGSFLHWNGLASDITYQCSETKNHTFTFHDYIPIWIPRNLWCRISRKHILARNIIIENYLLTVDMCPVCLQQRPHWQIVLGVLDKQAREETTFQHSAQHAHPGPPRRPRSSAMKWKIALHLHHYHQHHLHAAAAVGCCQVIIVIIIAIRIQRRTRTTMSMFGAYLHLPSWNISTFWFGIGPAYPGACEWEWLLLRHVENNCRNCSSHRNQSCQQIFMRNWQSLQKKGLIQFTTARPFFQHDFVFLCWR